MEWLSADASSSPTLTTDLTLPPADTTSLTHPSSPAFHPPNSTTHTLLPPDPGLTDEEDVMFLVFNNSQDPGWPLDASTTEGANASVDYVYDYDYSRSVNNLPLTEFIVVALVYGTTLFLGVVGNILVIFAISRYRRMHSVTNTFLLSLASADLLLVFICVPIKFAKFYSFTWDFGEFLCKMVHYMQNVSVICSVLTLTGMSIERYYAILHPMRAKYMCTVRRARRVILLVWLLSFILAVPIIFGQVHKEVGTVRTGYWCIREWERPEYARLYGVGMFLLILLAPLAIMTWAYFSICRELWMVTSLRSTMRAPGRESAPPATDRYVSRGPHLYRRAATAPARPHSDDVTTRKQVIKMLVAIIILFAICWGPFLVDTLLVAFDVLSKLHYGYLKHMRQAFACMAYFNSCVNPIVYAFMSRNFRETFKNALCACMKGDNFTNRWRANQHTHHTRSTSLTLTRSYSEIDNKVLRSSPTNYSVGISDKMLVCPDDGHSIV